jgi:hypothetical protein
MKYSYVGNFLSLLRIWNRSDSLLFFFAGSESATRACRSRSRSETRSDLLDILKTVTFLQFKVVQFVVEYIIFPLEKHENALNVLL